MERYETKIQDDVLYVETPEKDWLEVGSMADIYELAGGTEFDIEYDERHAAYFDWLDVGSDGVMTIDVREALSDMSYPGAFVERLAARSLAASERDGPPERTAYFVDVMTDVWTEKGNIDDEDNPFL